jgi:hypothetical protein
LILAAALLSLFLFLFFDCAERQIRLSGMMLQLLGVLTLLIGLRDTRNVFADQPTAWEAIKQWWHGRPRFGPQGVTVNVEAAQFVLSPGRVRMSVTAGPNTPIERRIELLEQNHERLVKEVDGLHSNLEEQKRDQTKALETERKERLEGDQTVKTQLKSAIAEGIPLELIGVGFFALGIAAGTASPEIAAAFGAARSCN